MLDVSNPANPVFVCEVEDVPGIADLTVQGSYVYLAARSRGVHVVDITNPANCVYLGGVDTSGSANAVVVVSGKIYVADGFSGLVVLPTLDNVQFTVRIEATPGVAFTLEAAASLAPPGIWTALLTTNTPNSIIDYVDLDVKVSKFPEKYYRVRQPKNWCAVLLQVGHPRH